MSVEYGKNRREVQSTEKHQLIINGYCCTTVKEKNKKKHFLIFWGVFGVPLP